MVAITNCYTTAAGTFAIALRDRRAESAHSIVSSFAILSRQLNNDGPFQRAISLDLVNLKSRFAIMLSRSKKGPGCLKTKSERDMASANERHTRPIIMGDYRIIWCRSLTSGEVFYRVYYREAMDPMSDHRTKADAKAAAKRYAAADARRDRDRAQGKERPLTEHLRNLGCLGPVPN